jgi:hypothetical protein
MNFALDVSKWVKKANGNTTLVLRKVALDMFGRVIQRSPVDTGRFRGNWQCAIGHDPAGTSENTSNPMGQIAGVVGSAKGNDAIHLVNNLPYGPRLERGWSKQAPSGMIGVTITEFQAAVDRAAGSVK